jgi:hypothetical protein
MYPCGSVPIGREMAEHRRRLTAMRGVPESITTDNGLNASEKCGMSAQGFYSTQGMRAVDEISSKKAEFPKWSCTN